VNKIYILALFFLASCSSFFQKNEVDLADRRIVEFAKSVKDTGLFPVGIGGGIDHETGKNKLFSLIFGTNDTISSLEEARVLFVEILESFIDFINNDIQIRESLAVFPVTIENINMSIVCMESRPKDIADMSNCGQILYYYAENENPAIIAMDRIHKETFEEAQRIVNQQREEGIGER